MDALDDVAETPSKQSKRKGKGKGKGKKEKGKNDESVSSPRTNVSSPSSPATPTPEQLAYRKKIACRFVLNGKTCKHGSNCHFSHAPEVIAKAKEEAKKSAAKAAEVEEEIDLNAELIGEGEPANGTVAIASSVSQTGLLGAIAASTITPAGSSSAPPPDTSSFRQEHQSGFNSSATPTSASEQGFMHNSAFQGCCI